ncbi:hypothetical protein B5E87_00230 [Massilimicrobiota sp. An142]|uniref:phage portal protein n=1 Tax=Massilimicrobiota sp. An142 TaxID=1965564 RepID=UPI000B39A239|nr:phage portal protein [Massilimicrobiota sp. An142]OUQ15033.1 hypothetical protein B5E87_00230 [Massilimicrobiota sp. An142]
MLNYESQIIFIKKNPDYLLELVEEHISKVNAKKYEEKEKYYHFKNTGDSFDFSLGELLVDTYSGLAINDIYIQNKTDRDVERVVKNVLSNVDFTNSVKDKCLKKSCILGTSFIQLAIEKNNKNDIGDLRILTLSPYNTFVKYDEFSRGRWAFRYYLSTDAVGRITDKSHLVVEFIDDKYITIFEKNLDKLVFKKTYLHGFDKLPIAEFSLNEYRSDILTKAIKGTRKAVEVLNNADFALRKALKEYMIAHNIQAPDGVDIADVVKNILINRVGVVNDKVTADGAQKLESGIEIVSGSGITNFSEWLEFCKYIVQLVFITSNIPNFQSEDFVNPQSGEALKMQLIPANAKIGSTVGFFKKSIRYILEVLEPYFRVKYNLEYNVEDFEINITSYQYSDINEVAQAITQLSNSDMFSDETLIKLSGIVEDASKEIEAKQAQDAKNLAEYINR